MPAAKIAVIGAGWAARIAHLPAYTANRTTPVAIADLNTDVADVEAKKHGIPNVYSDWREMIEKEKPDAVSVCVPNVYHREPVLGCLEAGAHVLCEKPLATSVAEAKEMFAAADKAGKKLMAAQNWRWNDNSRAIRRIIDAATWARSTTARPPPCAAWASRPGACSTTSSTPTAAPCSTSACTCWTWPSTSWTTRARPRLCPDGREVRQAPRDREAAPATPGIPRNSTSRTSPSPSSISRTAPRCCCARRGPRTSTPRPSPCRVVGTEAGATTRRRASTATTPASPSTSTSRRPGRLDCLLHPRDPHWLDVIAGKAEPLVNAEETLNVQRIIDAAYRSAEEGRDITVEAST